MRNRRRDNGWEFAKNDENQASNPRRLEKPMQYNWKQYTPRHIVVKLLETKAKEKTVQEARERRHITNRGAKTEIMEERSSETESELQDP